MKLRLRQVGERQANSATPSSASSLESQVIVLGVEPVTMVCSWDGHSVVTQRDSCPKAPEKAVIFSRQANSGDQLRNQIYTSILYISEILVEVECGISEDAKNIYNPGDLDSAFSFPRWRETPQNFFCPSWSDIFHMDKYLYP